MHKGAMRLIRAALATALACIGAPGLCATLEGKVVAVADGDTVTVLVDGHRQVHVRIAGIDAPEKKQAFGQRAKQSMSECAFGKEVVVEWKKIDRYGRTVGKVSADGVDCGLRQIETGLAWHYKAYAKEQTVEDRAAYSDAETGAVARKTGLWSDVSPIPPWDFRHHSAANRPN